MKTGSLSLCRYFGSSKSRRARLRSEGITVASDVRRKREDIRCKKEESIIVDDESQPMGQWN